MATPRAPPIERYELRFTVKPFSRIGWLSRLRPMYVVGEKPLFNLVVENPSDKGRYGKIALRWRLRGYVTHRVISINVGPKETKEYKIKEREWLVMAGEAIYELVHLPQSPEHYNAMPDNEVKKEAMEIPYVDPLCVYVVRDKAWLMLAIASIVATIVSVVMVIELLWPIGLAFWRKISQVIAGC
jgi:hypothetical protein